MSQLTVEDGKLVLRDGKLGTGQACCCGGCTGRCNFQVNTGGLVNIECQGGCECITHPCACFDIDENGTYPWYFCKTACVGERIAFAVCGGMTDEQVGEATGNMAEWVAGVMEWMEDNGYTAVTYDSARCAALESEGVQNHMIVVYGCCADGFDLEGECLNVVDLEPAADEKPYSGSVVRYNADGTNQPAPDCEPPLFEAGFVVPPCAGNPLP